MCGKNEDDGDGGSEGVNYEYEKYGSKLKFDPEFTGPQKSRSCTDVLCLLLFIVFLLAWAGVSIFGNENIAKNNLSNNFTAKDAMKLWQEITNKLNACLGPVKTWKAWRKCWQDMKSITKAKAAAYNREGTQTGGGAPEFSEPNDFQKRVMALIGKNATHGHEDVQESPIIFDIENPSETHANEEKNSIYVDSSDLSSFDQTPSTSKSPSTSAKFVSTLLPTSNPPSTFIQTLSTSHPPTFSSPSSKTTTQGTKGSIRKTRQTTLKTYKSGSPERLVFPTDSLGQQCGVDESVKNKKFLMFFDLSKCAKPAVIVTGCPTPQVCVEKCPNQDFFAGVYTEARSQFNAAEVQSQLVCWYGFDKGTITSVERLKKAIDDHNCAPWYLNSEASDKMSIGQHHPAVRNPLLGRCLPTVRDSTSAHTEKKREWWGGGGRGRSGAVGAEPMNRQELLKGLQDNFHHYSGAVQFGEMMLQDLTKVWPYILVGLAVSMVVCLLFILLMRWLAGIMVWLSIFGVIGLLSFAIYLCYSRYAQLAALGDDQTDKAVETKDLSISAKDLLQLDLNEVFKINFKSTLAKKETWMVFLIIAASVLAIILLILIFLRNRIRIAIELIREASRAVGSVTSTLFFPIVPWLVQLLALAWGLSVALYLASSGSPEYRFTGENKDCACEPQYKPGDVCVPEVFKNHCVNMRTSDVSCGCQFFAHRTEKYVPWLQAFNLFGTLWLLFFISALGEMTLAGVFGAWYWTWNKAKGLPFFALTESIWRAFRYHVGTLAFGSLLIAICRFIRIMLEYIHHKLKKRDNKLVQCLLCCLRCCFWCLEKFLRFLNRNAYVMCAVHGTNFCKSAKDAFNLLMRNIVRVVVIDKVTDFLLFLGKILIVAGMAVLSYYVFGHQSEEVDKHVPQLHYFFLPIIVIAVGTYFIATVFFGVYAMAVDTLFLCFLEDGERNDGSAEKPYFMSKNLMKILGKKNQFRDADTK